MLIGYDNKTIIGKIKKYLDLLYLDTICKSYIKLFVEPDQRKLQHYLSFFLIFKDEAPFLKEWLDYHIVVGVEHFYLYNNFSSDNYKEILEPYIQSGFVTLIDWPYEQAQAQAYKHCMETYKDESNWIAFIDADEFVCPKYVTDIKIWLIKFAKFPAVNVKWLQFGSNGIIKHDYSKSVIEQYKSCWLDFHKLGKCFVNTRYEVCNWNTMFFHHRTHVLMRIMGIKQPVPAISQFGSFDCQIHEKKNQRLLSEIQINHYYSKAWDLVNEKTNKSDVYFKDIKRSLKAFWLRELECSSLDNTIMRFFIKFKYFQETGEL